MIVDQLFTTYTVVGNTKQFFSESRHNKMLKEDVTYRKFHNLSRMIVERKMSEKEILDLFAAIEAGANATGQNRTALGRGKDVVAGVRRVKPAAAPAMGQHIEQGLAMKNQD